MIALVDAGGGEVLLMLGDVRVGALRVGVRGEGAASADPDEVLHVRQGPVGVRVRRFDDLDASSLILTVENTGDTPVAVPTVALTVTPDAAWSGWSWTSDTEGFVLLSSPTDAVVLQLRRGHLRAVPGLPVFGGEPTVLGEGPPGAGVFHLFLPGNLAAGERRRTVLRAGRLPDAEAAASMLPAWLPPLVEPVGTEVALETPDQGVVPGPGVDATLTGHTLLLSGAAGHREVALHGVRGVQRLRVSWVPGLGSWLAEVAHVLRSRRPSAVSSATGAVVAEALARGAVLDRDAVVDWLEREDWLARGDALGVATAALAATHAGDEALLADAWAAVAELPVTAGFGFVAMKVWLGLLSVSGAAPDLAGTLLRRPPLEGLAALELSLLGGGDRGRDEPELLAAVRRLGGTLPGQPLGLSASEAARLVGVLRLCPEGWPTRRAASGAAEKAASLLLADYADGLHDSWDGLAWLLMGQLGS